MTNIHRLTGASPLALLLAIAPSILAAAPAPEAAPAAIAEPGAFRDKPAYDRKKGVTIAPATAGTIRFGMDKDAVYRIVGTPHFGETITRRFDYVLNFPAGARAPAMRCRMGVLFDDVVAPAGATRHMGVSRVIWQTQACADRVTAG